MPTIPFGQLLGVLLTMGLINYISTAIITENKVFEDIRKFVRAIGEWFTKRPAWAQLYKLSLKWRVRQGIRGRVGRCLYAWSLPRSHLDSRIGPKIAYFAKCPMCVGVWVGFALAAVFGGPLYVDLSWTPGWIDTAMTGIAIGLAYKGVGHFMFQLGKLLHHTIDCIEAYRKYIESLTPQKKQELEPTPPLHQDRAGHPTPSKNGELVGVS